MLHRLVVFGGQRLSYRTLDVEQIGSVYESLMGYHVLRVASPAVRLGKFGVWVESDAALAMPATERAKFWKETCGLNPGAASSLEKAMKRAGEEKSAGEALASHAAGRKSEIGRHRAEAGRLVLQPGEERHRTASHYTPRSLTEKIVRRTLEPLLACLGAERTPDQILQLKICDPSMGSGAFLVATCRELASEMVIAWTRGGALAAILEQHGDAHLHARRLVAQRCLYGVDKNAAAVELAKLSLWLITLSKTLPFTFVDHALRHGDSLVGLDFRQIEAFHWSPPGQVETCRVLLREALDQAVELRQAILALAAADDPAAQAEKRRLLEFAEQAIDRVRLVADVCVGAFFAESKDAAREKERMRRLGVVETWLRHERRSADESRSEDERAKDAETTAAARSELEALASLAREMLSPFHWWIEFPEVFFDERPDPLQAGAVNGAALMEGVVGNPPFGGKNSILDSSAEGYLDWLKVISPGAHGNSDLSAHFFRRAAALLGEHGAFGLIATNTIAQGDTRSTGLAALVATDWELYDATHSMPWPGDAGVTVSVIHAAHGTARGRTERRLGGAVVEALNSRLRPKPERSDPQALTANASAAFVGCYVLGMGFTLTPDERASLVTKNAKNAERIFPYLGGEEVNTSPTQSFHRYAISFGQMPLDQAEEWPDLISILRTKVKPERDRNNRENYRKVWWLFGEYRPGLFAAIAQLSRCLVTARVTKHLVFSFQQTDRIFSDGTYVFPLAAFTAFAVLQSRVHEPWTLLLSSSLGRDNQLRYSASDCFETFPFPRSDPRAVLSDVETAGQALYDARALLMVDTDQGLTKTYNALKDPACTEPRILALRVLHEAMDRAVLDAYGWSDLVVPPYCPLTNADKQALQLFEDEIIDHLYVLNAERARDEARLGLATKKSKHTTDDAPDAESDTSAPPGSAAKKAGGKRTSKAQKKLF